MQRILPLISAALISFAMPAGAYSSDGFKVCGLDPNGDNFLALRSGPGSNYAMLAKLGPGTVVWDWDRRGKWYKVSVGDVNGPEGWVYSGYLCLFEDH